MNRTEDSPDADLGGRLLTAREVGDLLQLNASWVLDAARRNARADGARERIRFYATPGIERATRRWQRSRD